MRAMNIIKFLRGCWWGAHPSTLLTFYKSFVRPIIDYASFLYFPLKNTKVLKIERIQYQAIRLSLGYIITTPTNILTAEAKLMRLIDRAKFLGTKFIIRNLSNSSSPSNPFIRRQFFNCLRISSSKYNILQYCITQVFPFKDLIMSENIYNFDFQVLNVSLPVNIDVGSQLNLLENPGEIFSNHITNDNVTQIFTDGSKSPNKVSVGTACIVPESDYHLSRSLDKIASIYTAESLALYDALKYTLLDKSKNYNIYSDSLSNLLNLSKSSLKVSQNFYNIKSKEAYLQFLSNNNETQVHLFWVPSHKNIFGNELADNVAKQATENPPMNLKIPHADLYPLLKSRFLTQTHNTLLQESESKGKKYFECYFEKKRKPWFEGFGLSRQDIVQINRCRADHYHLNYSLHRMNLIDDPSCPCGNETQDLDHIIWQCPTYDEERTLLLKSLANYKIFPPCTIHIFLKKPHIAVMKIILEFFERCKIKV